MTRLETILQDLLRAGKISFSESTALLASVELLTNDLLIYDKSASTSVHPIITKYGTHMLEGMELLNKDI